MWGQTIDQKREHIKSTQLLKKFEFLNFEVKQIYAVSASRYEEKLPKVLIGYLYNLKSYDALVIWEYDYKCNLNESIKRALDFLQE